MLISFEKDHDINVQIYIQIPQGIFNLYILAIRVFIFMVFIIISLLLRHPLSLTCTFTKSKDACLKLIHSALVNSKNSNSVAWNRCGMEYSRQGSAVQTGTVHSKYVET